MIAIIAGLAATRLIRAYFHEQIGEIPKKIVDDWTSQIPIQPGTDQIDMRAVKIRQFIGDLTSCPHCLGFWFTVVCVIGLKIPVARVFVTALAGAMILSAIVDHYPAFDFNWADDEDES